MQSIKNYPQSTHENWKRFILKTCNEVKVRKGGLLIKNQVWKIKNYAIKCLRTNTKIRNTILINDQIGLEFKVDPFKWRSNSLFFFIISIISKLWALEWVHLEWKGHSISFYRRIIFFRYSKKSNNNTYR